MSCSTLDQIRESHRTTEPHFVADYSALVRDLLRKYPEDEAMRRAVGDLNDVAAPIERDIVLWVGLNETSSLVDVGCGCGQLASQLADFLKGPYLGTDIVPELLEYARRRVPANFHFALVRDLEIPAEDESVDMVALFSVLTHLHQAESYRLLDEARRVLRPGGAAVASHLEFGVEDHWQHFAAYVEAERPFHLNALIESAVFDVWGRHLGLTVEHRIPSGSLPWGLQQSFVVLRKRPFG